MTGQFDPVDWKWRKHQDHSFSVMLRHADSALEISGDVDDSGNFSIPLVPAGSYRIMAEHMMRIRTFTMSFDKSGGDFEMPEHNVSGLQVRPPKR